MTRKFYLLLLFLMFFAMPWSFGQETVKERIIYVPQEEWENVIKTQPKGVSLSYQQYLELLQKQPKEQSKPKSSIVVGSIYYEGKMVEKTLYLEMDMLLTCLSQDPEEFMFEFGKMGVEKAMLNDKEALIGAEEFVPNVPVIQQSRNNDLENQEFYQQRLVRQAPVIQQNAQIIPPPNLEPKVRYRVLLPGKGEYQLKMFFYKRLSTQKDELKANLVLGAFPQQTFVLKTQEDMEYTIEPFSGEPKDGKITIYMGNRSEISLSIRPKEQKDVKQPLYLAHVYASHLVRVDSLSSLFQVSLEVYYQPQKTFAFYIPSNIEILSISENRWESVIEGDRKKITVQLEEAVDRTHTISIKCERQLLGDKEFSLPWISASGQNLLRQDGLIYIEKTSDIQLEIKDTKEVRQTTTESLFPKGKGASPTLLKQFGEEAFAAFKHAHTDYSIIMNKKEIVPVIESTFVSAISLYQDGLECVNHITFDVMEGKAKQVSIEIPHGWSVDSVDGYIASNFQNFFRKFNDFSYYLKDSILYVSLRNKIIPGEKLRISLKLQNMPEGWQSRWEERQMVLPLVKPLFTKYLPSFAGVIVDPDYQIEVSHIAYAQSVDLNILRSLQISSKNLRLGLKLNEDKASIGISLKQKPSYLDLTAASYLSVEPERIRCLSVLVYEIKNASQNSLRFMMPKGFTYMLNISDEFGLIKEREQKDNKEGQEWIIKLQKRVIGTFSLYLSYEIPIQSIESYLDFPVLQFPDVEQRKGFIGIAGISQAEIAPVILKGLTKILNTELPIIPHPELPRGTEYLHAFKYANADYQLGMEIKMHGKVDVTNSILENVVISTLYPQKDLERVVCEYTLSHIGMQYFDLTLPKDVNIWSAVVDDKGEKPVRQKDNTLSIPVPRETAGKANIIRLVYERKVAPLDIFGTLTLERPQTLASIPVKKFQWFLYLPPEYKIAQFSDDVVSGPKPWYKTLVKVTGDILMPVLYYEKSVSYKMRQDTYSMPQQNESQAIYDGEMSQNIPSPSVMPPPMAGAPKLSDPAKPGRISRDSKDKSMLKERRKREEHKSKMVEQKMQKKIAPKGEVDELESMEDLPMEESVKSEAPQYPEVEEDNGLRDDFAESETKSEEAPAPLEPSAPEPAPEQKPTDIYEGKESKEDYDWGNKVTPKTPMKPKVPYSRASKRTEEDQTGVSSVKAKGLRSLDIQVLDSSRVYQTRSIGRQLPPSLACIAFLYFHEETMNSLLIGFATVATLLGLIFLAQRKVPGIVVIMMLLLIVSFIPLYFGEWLTMYSNAIAWGLLGSFVLRIAYKILWKIGTWVGFCPKAIALILIVIVTSVPLMAQETSKLRQIYVSYDPEKLEQLDQVNKVFLPYETYVTLWNNAYPDRPLGMGDKKPHAPYFLYHANYQGRILGERTQFNVTFLLEVSKTPVAIPLGLSQTAVEKAVLYKEGESEGQEVTLKPTNMGYSLMVTQEGRYRVEMQFLPEGSSIGKRGQFRFGMTPVATSVLEFKLDADMDANLSNFFGDWYEKKDNNSKSIVMFPGLNKQMDMEWYQSSESYRARGLNISANSTHNLIVSDSLLRLESKIQYQILSGKIDKLNLKVPKDYSILQLSCTNLERWILSEENDKNNILIRLVDNSAKNITLDLIADKVLPQIPAQVSFPDIVPVEAERENGQAILITQNFYNVIVTKHDRLRKVSSYERNQRFYEVFRYNEHPYNLEFSIQQQEYYNFSRSQLIAKMDEEKFQVNYRTTLEVKGKEIFSYQIHCPKDMNITRVAGNFVKSWKVEQKENQQILNIPFQGSLKKGERTEIFVDMEKELKGEKSLDLPYLSSPQVQYSSGDILVASSRDLSLTAMEIKGLQEFEIAYFADIPNYVKRYAFRFEGTEYQSKLEIQSQQAQVEVDAIINLLVEDDWINFGYFLRYKIQFAGADTFIFRLPIALGEEIDILGENIKETKKIKQGKHYVWKVVLHTKVRDQYMLALFPRVSENKGTGILFQPIEFPPQVGSKLYVLIQNHSQYELNPQKVEGITLIGTNQLAFYPPQTAAQDFLLAYKIEKSDWELTFSENKQSIVHTVKASIDNIKVNTFIDKEGNCRHRIVYNIRHMGLQFMEIERMQNCKIWGIFVSGFFVKPVKKTVQGKEILLVPLQQNFSTAQKEERLSVRMIYSEKLSSLKEAIPHKIPLPLVSNIKEVGNVNWSLHLPKGYIYRFGGNISPSEEMSFVEYVPSASYDANDALKQMNLNKQLLQSAISRENRLKIRQDNYLKETEKSQQKIFSNVLDIKQQSNSWNDSNLQQVKQYGMQNIEAARRAFRDQSGQSQPTVYKDQKSEKFAGEENTIFLQRQDESVQKIFMPQEKEKKQTDPIFSFDLEYPGDVQIFHFAKKQGDATIEIRPFLEPSQNKTWLGIQFGALFLLVILCGAFRLFSLKDGYSFRKFALTIFFILLSCILFNVLEFVHHFYL